MAVESLKLLVIGGSDAEASALADTFREAGHAVAVEHVERDEEINLVLQRGPFSLAIATPLAGELPLEKIGAALGSTPWIARIPATDGDATVAALEAGAAGTADPARPRELLLKGLGLARRQASAPATDSAAGSGEACLAYFSDGMILQANEAFARLLGHDSPDDLDCLPVIDLIAEQDKDKFKALLKSLGSRPSEIGISIARSDGEEVLVAMTLSNATHDGEVCKQMSITLGEDGGSSGLSMNDSVTGLINRQFFLDHLSAALVQAANVTTVDHVLFISIDQFEQLLARYGLPGADAILADLARIVRARTDKRHYLSRFGDNTLALMLPHSDGDEAQAFAGELCTQVAEHICEMGDQTVQYTISIGITVLNAKSPRDPVELLDQCRQAVEELRSKSADKVGNGANAFSRTTRKATAAAAGASTTEPEKVDLEEAIDQGRMRLLFQPLLSIKGDAGDHYEAYVRLLDNDDQLQAPGTFMDQVNAKLASKLDRWVILEGIKHLSQQIAKGKDTRLIVNLTAFTMEDAGLTTWLKVAMQAGDVPPNAMIFQLPEEDFARNINLGKEFAERMKGIGCCLSLSHFGSGANDPATVLRHLPVDYVKLSPKYTTDIQDGSGDPQPLKDLVAKVAEARKKAVVPSVENASMLAILWQASTNFIQGNYLQAPQPEMNYEFSDIA